jgi:hypothetical protein
LELVSKGNTTANPVPILQIATVPKYPCPASESQLKLNEQKTCKNICKHPSILLSQLDEPDLDAGTVKPYQHISSNMTTSPVGLKIYKPKNPTHLSE